MFPDIEYDTRVSNVDFSNPNTDTSKDLLEKFFKNVFFPSQFCKIKLVYRNCLLDVSEPKPL